MRTNDFISLMVAYYKDKVSAECMSKISASYNEMMDAEADCRRQKAAALVLSMAKLKITLEKFQKLYDPIKEKYGSMEAAEQKIISIQGEIRELSAMKNHM